MESVTDFAPEAVVIDAGDFPENKNALRWLDECGLIVCCDGAANNYLSTHSKVWRIVGDCDSLSPEIAGKYHDIIRRFPDQETNDQTKAVTYLAGKGFNRIAILGATGKREDHTLGNISLLLSYLGSGIEARIYTDYGVFIPVRGTKTFYCTPGSQVSIFNFNASGMKSDGLKYPIRDFDSLWQGTLNEATSGKFTIHAIGSYLVFINY